MPIVVQFGVIECKYMSNHAHTLYFAYGSNLSLSQMKRRCPEYELVGVAKLDGWKFQYDGTCDDWSGKAVGNIVKSRGSNVLGVVYKLTQNDCDLLDDFEDYPVDYEKKIVTVILSDKNTVSPFVYTRYTVEPIGVPSRQYVDTILTGAVENKLPSGYIRSSLQYDFKFGTMTSDEHYK